MTAFATVSDVAARWRPLSDAEEIIAATLLDDASDIIRLRFPDVDDRITAGTLSADSVTRIVATMVKRAMINMDTAGVAQRSQTAGPFAVSDKFTNPTGNLYLTADELLLFEVLPYLRAKQGWLA